MSNLKTFAFQQHESNLLHNVLNEVLNGFEVKDMKATIGMERQELERLLDQLHHSPQCNEVQLSMEQTRAFGNALRETLHELGGEEFQTRTGYTFDEGERILKYIQKLTDQSEL